MKISIGAMASLLTTLVDAPRSADRLATPHDLAEALQLAMKDLREGTTDLDQFRNIEIPAMPPWLLLVVKSATRKAISQSRDYFSVLELSSALAEECKDDIDPQIATDLIAMAGHVTDSLFDEPSWQGTPIARTASIAAGEFRPQEP
jgi:hypothetical protein